LRWLAIEPIGDSHCGTQAGSVGFLRQCNQVSRDCAQRLVIFACSGNFHSERFAEGFSGLDGTTEWISRFSLDERHLPASSRRLI